MSRVSAILGLALVIGGLAGCHGTRGLGRGCCPNYGYCKPNPMPYTSYCGCPTPKASQYAIRLREGANPVEVASPQMKN
jgi:hypothetical protein